MRETVQNVETAPGDAPILAKNRQPISRPPFWQVPCEFAVHAIVGTCIFAIIAAVAVLLSWAIHKIEAYTTVTVIYLLTAAEYALLVTDLLLFGVFLWRTAKRAAGNL
jgi:hypothetical protein